MSADSAILWLVCGAAAAAAVLMIVVVRARLDAMDRRLHELQKVSDQRSWYDDLHQDRSVLELLRSLLDLNDSLRQPHRETSGPGKEGGS
jgi:hypothetical protein